MEPLPLMKQYREEFDADLELAERVHRSLIPKNGRRGDLEIACRFQPMIGVGGDYASVYFQSASKVVVCVSDVSGHGFAAALLAGRINSFVLNQASSIDHPCQMGERLNSFFFEFFGTTNLFVSFFCLFLDLKTHSLTYAGFGHPPVFLCSKNKGSVEPLESRNTFIGISEELVQQCSMFTVPYEPGDRLILYTDGISEATNRQGKLLDIPRLQAMIHEHGHLPVNDHVDAIIEGVDTFRDGAVPDDDQLLLAVSFRGNQ
jgi:serine phosphatase RsbU (regulator of sigma subunit)